MCGRQFGEDRGRCQSSKNAQVGSAPNTIRGVIEPSRRRLPLPLAGTALFLLGTWLAATRPASFTWVNTGLSIDYPPPAWGGALLAAGAAGLASLGQRRGPRLAAAAATTLALLFALHLVRYRVVVEEGGVSQRGLLGTTRLPWRQVTRVERGSQAIVVWGGGADEQVRVDAAPLSPENRARLERTLARHLREAKAR